MSSIAIMPPLSMVGTTRKIVSVTWADIVNGVRRQCDVCPIAIALKRLVARNVQVAVYGNSVTFTWAGHPGIMDGRSVDLPPACTDFALAFDAGEQADPFEFRFDLPNDVPAAVMERIALIDHATGFYWGCQRGDDPLDVARRIDLDINGSVDGMTYETCMSHCEDATYHAYDATHLPDAIVNGDGQSETVIARVSAAPFIASIKRTGIY